MEAMTGTTTSGNGAGSAVDHAPTEEEAAAAASISLERQGRVLRFLRRATKQLRWKQLAKLVSARDAVFDKLREVPNRMQKLARQLHLLLDLVEDYYDGHYRRVPWYSLAIAVAATLYFLSPADVIPDTLPVIGQIDDLLVLAVALRLLRRDLRAYARFKGLDPEEYV